LVTLPFVLLLLDYWPLGRLNPSGFGIQELRSLVLEKTPFFALTIAACVLTYFVQSHGAIDTLVTAGDKIENALISYGAYLWKLFWPARLAVFYPYRDHWPIALVFGSGALILALTVFCFLQRIQRPYLLVGWIWYLVTLVPVIGLVQVGEQAMADRYMYLPSIGLSLMVAYGMADLLAKWPCQRVLLGSLAGTAVVILVFCARLQCSYWANSETLWNHALACTSGNAVALNNVGIVLAQKGQVGAAIIEYQKALAIAPNDAQAHCNLGLALSQKGQVDAAIVEYHKALAIDPNFAKACNNLGIALSRKGQVDAAIIEYHKALAIDPNLAKAYNNLGIALSRKGRVDAAIVEYQKALAINPMDLEARTNLAVALAQQKEAPIASTSDDLYYNLGNDFAKKGELDEAIIEYQKALAINPDDVEARNNLGISDFRKGQVDEAIIQFQKVLAIQPGSAAAQNNLTRVAWMLATSPNPSFRDGTKAVELALQTDRLSGGDNPMTAATLAAAYAEARNFPEAITNVQRALQLASSQNNAAMSAAFQAQLKCYQAGSPFRDSGTTP
ncbi:MAG TPA: tetratricopeptide repeat protein, partial [Verrucomicrobiae bacterium]|nr:tetratricopeptide repeat protein [Verrucomicrobiae bacterium]